MSNIMSCSGRDFSVEGMGGLAATAVAWFHLTNTYPPGLVQLTGAYGWLGVDVFFVISGFVVPLSIVRAFPDYTWRDFPRFVVRRLPRSEPPNLASIFLVILLSYASAMAPGFRGEPPSYEITQVASHLFYAIPLTGYHWMQPIYWTHAFEFL